MAVLVPSKSAFPFTERLIWRTQIVRGAGSAEQRISFRKVPRQILEYAYPFRSDAESAKVDNLVHRYAKLLWHLPLWGEQIFHEPNLTAGGTSIAVDTTNADWRAIGGGAYAVIWQSETKHEVVSVTGVEAGALTVSALANSYKGHKTLAPCRMGYLAASARGRMHSTGVKRVSLVFEVIDNQYATGHAAAMSYDDIEVLTDPAGMPGGVHETEIDPDAWVMDSPTGRRVLDPVSDYNVTTQSQEWVHKTRAACWSFRQWLHAINGPQKCFFVPTFRDDVTLAAQCLAADTTITVVNRGYSDYLTDNELLDYVAFRPSGSDIIVRRVDGMTELSATQERFTLDAAPGAIFASGSNLSWVHCCRLANDAVEIEWLENDVHRVRANLTRVMVPRLAPGESVPGMGAPPG